MPKITNPTYKELIDTKILTKEIHKEDFEVMLSKIEPGRKARNDLPAARAFFILLYYTGRRPEELLLLKHENFEESDLPSEKDSVKVVIPTLKKGQTSVLYLPKQDKYLKEVYDIAKKSPVGWFIFVNLMSDNTNKVQWYKKNEKLEKEYFHRHSSNVYWMIKKATGYPPYYFRHNRFTLMATEPAGAKKEPATIWELKHAKGAKTLASVEPYVNMTKERVLKMGRLYKGK